MVKIVFAVQKVACGIFDFQTARGSRIWTVLKIITKFMFIKMAET